MSETKSVVCHSCDCFCPLAAKVEDDRVVKVTTRDHPFFKDVICMKGAYAPKSAMPTAMKYAYRALEKQPDNAEALICMGQTDHGLEQVKRAMRINPHSPDWYRWTLAMGHYCARDYDEAIQALDLMVDVPKWSFLLRAATHAQRGEPAESAQAMRRFKMHMPTWTIAKEMNAIRFKREEDGVHWMEGLRKAQLPD